MYTQEAEDRVITANTEGGGIEKGKNCAGSRLRREAFKEMIGCDLCTSWPDELQREHPPPPFPRIISRIQ